MPRIRRGRHQALDREQAITELLGDFAYPAVDSPFLAGFPGAERAGIVEAALRRFFDERERVYAAMLVARQRPRKQAAGPAQQQNVLRMERVGDE